MPELMPHQLDALRRMHNGCVLRGPTGSGKSVTALAYFMDGEHPEKLIVITTAMKRDSGDWEAEAREWGLFPYVDSWQNISDYEDEKGAFFIFDEQRLVGSGAWVKSFLKIAKHNQWILLSATPGDSWLDYIPVFVANGFYRSRSEFLETHVMFQPFVPYPKVKAYLGENILRNRLASVLVDMPYEKHTKRHEIYVFAEYDREKYDRAFKARWNEEEGRPIRNISEMCAIIRRITNTDPSRIENVRNLLVTHPKMIIYYNFDYELEMLRTLDVPIAERNGHKHEKIPGGSEWAYLVQYASGSEAWNCTETDTIMFYAQTYSYKFFEQAKGRIDRLNTPFTDLYYYIQRSSSGIDRGISVSLETKKSFNEARWARSAI